MLGLYEAYKRAFYNWIKRRTRPYSIEEAEEKKAFWAKMYALVSGSAMVVFLYQAFKGNLNMPLREDLPRNVATAVAFTRNEPIRFVKYKGLQKVEDFTYSAEQLQELANQTPAPKPDPHIDNSKPES